ncbi:hypothetical protein IU449_18490 [Nocardia higoensis]|uniref:Uncharacterized protein n=1 Tax=Nocardia higoensis TaxID=228599 RepID=A0ABS0DF52_9NOCA|nr:hypothetical protein [Nocardia higoensis]MBF6356508.1 hypothetical protein [Nocardia higoensis]
MTVNEHDRIDQVAVGPDGRLVLVMVEERPYRDGDVAALAEDFRRKMNSYVHAVRSGNVAQLGQEHRLTDPVGVDIVLFCESRPPEVVEQMIGMVNRELADEGVTARWESWAGDAVGVDVIECALVTEVVESIDGAWNFALLWVTLVGGAGAAGVQVRRLDGTVDNLRPSAGLLELLSEHKRASYDAASGTWLSGQISIADPDRYRSEFSKTEIPDWQPAPTEEDLHAEFAVYARPANEIPDFVRRNVRSHE